MRNSTEVVEGDRRSRGVIWRAEENEYRNVITWLKEVSAFLPEFRKLFSNPSLKPAQV